MVFANRNRYLFSNFILFLFGSGTSNTTNLIINFKFFKKGTRKEEKEWRKGKETKEWLKRKETKTLKIINKIKIKKNGEKEEVIKKKGEERELLPWHWPVNIIRIRINSLLSIIKQSPTKPIKNDNDKKLIIIFNNLK